MNTSNAIVLLALVLILIPAIKGSLLHMTGQGACCGGPKEKKVRKRIKGPKYAEYIVKIDGMHCSNCKNRIEKNLDQLEGVIAKVNLEKKQALVSLYQPVDEDVIRQTIENLDFEVTDMQFKLL